MARIHKPHSSQTFGKQVDRLASISLALLESTTVNVKWKPHQNIASRDIQAPRVSRTQRLQQPATRVALLDFEAKESPEVLSKEE